MQEGTYKQLVLEGVPEFDLTLEFQKDGGREGYAFHSCGGCRCGCRCSCRCSGCGCRCACRCGCRSEQPSLLTGEGNTQPTGFDLMVAPATS